MPQVDLYYSRTLLGHFTLIVSDKVDLIVYRIHFVDADAEAAHSGRIAWAMHKIAQVTGYSTGKVLSDFKCSPTEFAERLHYSDNNRELIKGWEITVKQMDDMLNWVHQIVQSQNIGNHTSYGYVIYSDNVDNCGSFAIKCLARAGISITLPYLKQWFQLPSLIQEEI